jgi:hypothetical protein
MRPRGCQLCFDITALTSRRKSIPIPPTSKNRAQRQKTGSFSKECRRAPNDALTSFGEALCTALVPFRDWGMLQMKRVEATPHAAPPAISGGISRAQGLVNADKSLTRFISG